MAQIKEIIEIEKSRDDSLRSTVYLFKEGSFLRAYELSAWLICKFVSDFKVTHKMIKSLDQSVAFVGFPQTSLSKYTPEGCEVQQLQNDLFQIQLSSIVDSKLKEMDPLAAFEVWKSSFPITENSRKDDVLMQSQNKTAMSMTSVFQKIMSYPIESKSPIECMLFLADIKKDLSSLI